MRPRPEITNHGGLAAETSNIFASAKAALASAAVTLASVSVALSTAACRADWLSVSWLVVSFNSARLVVWD